MTSSTPDAALPTGAGKPRSYAGDYMARGREGEEIVLRWLAARPGVKAVEDLRADLAAQRDDVDCRVAFAGGREMLVEIKTDSYIGRTGNLVFEMTRINHTAPVEYLVTPGWSVRSTADLFAFYGLLSERLYLLTADHFRAGFRRFMVQLSRESAERGERFIATDTLRLIPTDAGKSTLLFYIPERYFEGMKVYTGVY